MIIDRPAATAIALLAALPAFAGSHTAEEAEVAAGSGSGMAAPAPDLGAFAEAPLSYGQRPAYLVSKLQEGELKDKLTSCLGDTPERTAFSIGHRGAPLMFPEHTVESNIAAAGQGAGILECDVTFTADQELVCRHAQDDLHTTTNIVVTDLADRCTQGFQPASGETEASAECRASDLTLAEFRELEPKMDAADAQATSPEEYLGGVAPWRTTLYADGATLMTHAESIALFDALGADFTPELKAPAVEMPFEGFSQEDYAQKLVDEYEAAGIEPARVWPQSFNLADILYWIDNTAFGAQAVYLDDRYDEQTGTDEEAMIEDLADPASYRPTMQELADMGVRYIAPPLWMLVTTDGDAMVPSAYARAATEAGLGLITWTLERSGPLADGGGWYFQSVEGVTDSDADYYNILHTLAQDVGVAGVFSDWPATVTFYANCHGL